MGKPLSDRELLCLVVGVILFAVSVVVYFQHPSQGQLVVSGLIGVPLALYFIVWRESRAHHRDS
jgi:hypothetical protein